MSSNLTPGAYKFYNQAVTHSPYLYPPHKRIIDNMTLEMPVLVFNGMLGGAIGIIPNVIAAIILLLVGWLLGRIIGDAVKKVMKKLRIDDYFKITKGVEISNIFSVAVSWIIYLLFVQTALSEQILGIPVLSVFFGDILTLIARLLGGMIIIIVGYIVARYVQKQITVSKTVYAGLAGQAIFLFAMIISFSIALNFVNIDTQLIDSIILILVGSIGIGLAIALGLGLKDTVARLSKKYIKKL